MSRCCCYTDNLCGPCTRILMDDLRIISGVFGGMPFRTLFEELDVTLSNTDKIGTMNVGNISSGSTDNSLHFNAEASDAKGQLRRTMLRVRNEMFDVNPHLRTQIKIEDIAGWLLVVTELLKSHPRVKVLALTIRHAVAEAQHAIDRPMDRFYLGECEGVIDGYECGASLYTSERTPEELTCRVCGTIHNVRSRRAWIVACLENTRVTAAQVDGWICPNGVEIRKDTIRKWKSRGLLEPQGKQGREWLYRMGDITALALRHVT